MPADVIYLEKFRAQRSQRDQDAEKGETEDLPRLPVWNRSNRVLNDRQLAHRRAMLEYGRQLRSTTVSPIERTTSRSCSFASASWIRSIGSMKGSLLNRKD